jgi:3-methylfumaryl-CoA hydratase
LLFQYSAATYNTHRIHYDHPYATTVEGYPGLLVHGPLTATLLMNLLLEHAPKRLVAESRISARRPIFAIAPFELIGHIGGVIFDLVALDSDNQVAMTIKGKFAQ